MILCSNLWTVPRSLRKRTGKELLLGIPDRVIDICRSLDGKVLWFAIVSVVGSPSVDLESLKMEGDIEWVRRLEKLGDLAR